MPEVFSFTATAKPTNITDLAVWTDGVILSSDNSALCAFHLKKGKKYRVTVEELPDEDKNIEELAWERFGRWEELYREKHPITEDLSNYVDSVDLAKIYGTDKDDIPKDSY
jgi:hypothetical protein